MCTTHAREGHVRRKDECFSCWLGKGKPAVGFSFCIHGERRHRCQLCPGKSPVPLAMTHIPNDADRPSSFTAATATSEATEIETEALVAHRRQHKRPRPCEGFRAAHAHPAARDVIYGNNGVPVYAELELRSTQESLRVLQLELCRLQPTQQDLVSAPVNGRGDRVLIKIPSYTKKGRRWVEEPFVSALKSFMVASIGCRREVLTMLSAMNKEHDTSTAKYIFTGCLYIAPKSRTGGHIQRQEIHTDTETTGSEICVAVSPTDLCLGTVLQSRAAGMLVQAETTAFVFDQGWMHAGPAWFVPPLSTFPYFGPGRFFFHFLSTEASDACIADTQERDGLTGLQSLVMRVA